jgi:hypothetical protein
MDRNAMGRNAMVDGEAGEPMVNRVLCELFGEIVLNAPCFRQPRIVRPGVAGGLELLDLILNPDHVVRTTEELSFAGALTLHRRFRVDVMLDRISSQREAGASQLAALLSERPVTADAGRPERLWTPLLHIPRPVVVPIDVFDSYGELLPRPPQREIRTLLEAAVYHLLRESLHTDADFEREDSQLGRLMRTADVARWTLQAAVLAVCDRGTVSPQSYQRLDALLAAAGCTDLSEVDDDRLSAVVKGEADEHKQLALAVLHDKISGLPALLELVELVHGNYFIIAGLDPARRDHSVRFTLPDVEASPRSPDLRLVHRVQQTLDPRDHNFTARIRVRVPTGMSQYRMQLTGSVDAEGDSETAMAVVAAVGLDPEPAARDLAAVASCRDRLRQDIASLESGEAEPPAGHVTTVNYEATEARAALESLRSLAGRQRQRADGLRARWSRASSRLFVWQVGELGASAAALQQAADAAIARADELARLTSPLPARGEGTADGPSSGAVAGRARALLEALDGVAAAAGDPRLGLHLVGDDPPGQDVGRIRVNRPLLASAPHSEAKTLDVWVTMSDEALPYATSMLLPPLALFTFIWLFGALLFESASWMYSYSLPAGVDAHVLDRPADALAAILLLIPGIAMTLVRMPKPTSVRARLRRAARSQVYTAVAVLSVCATVVATRAGSDATERLDLLLVLRVLRGAGWIFLAWIVWSVCAWALRGTFVWMPKGLSREIAARRPVAAGMGDRVLRWFLGVRQRADVELVVADSGQAVPEHLRGGLDEPVD